MPENNKFFELTKEQLSILERDSSVDLGNHWVIYTTDDGKRFLAERDGLYGEAYSSFEDLLKRENVLYYYEYSPSENKDDEERWVYCKEPGDESPEEVVDFCNLK